MQVVVLRTTAELLSVSAEWKRLPRPSIMQSPAWLIPWWESYAQPSQELSVLAVRDGSGLVGLVPWYAETVRGTRRLRWLGDGRVCSDHTTLLCDPRYGSQVVTAVANWLTDAAPDRWQQLALDSVDTDDATVHQLIESLEQRGFPVARRPEPGTCCIELPKTWDDYLASVSKNHRKKCRRVEKQGLDACRAKLEVHTGAAECLAALDVLAELHNERRMSLGDEGAFANPRFLEFHRSALAGLTAERQVQLRMLSIDGRPAAAEYVLTGGDTWFAYQGGLSARGAELGAAMLSMIFLIRDAIAAGCRRLDLLRGVEAYKLSWGAAHRPASTIIIRRRNFAGRCGAWGETAIASAKLLKRQLAHVS